MQHNITDERGKLFVGGLSWETTHDSMLNFFSRYGEVIDCVVMKNPGTGKSRGFGFVTFRDPACIDLVLASTPHTLDGRQIDPKACNPRSLNRGGKNLENSKRKIFIGGLPANITDTQLKEEFSRYGKVVDVVIMLDQQKQKSRGFGFLTFESEEAVDSVVQLHFVEVNGKQVEVKRAEPRDLKMVADSGNNPHSLLSLWPPQTPWGLTPLSLLPTGPGWATGTGVRGLLTASNGTPLTQLATPIGRVNPMTGGLLQATQLANSDGIRLVSSATPYVLINAGSGGVAMNHAAANGMSLQTLSPQAGSTAQAATVLPEMHGAASPYGTVLDATDLASLYTLKSFLPHGSCSLSGGGSSATHLSALGSAAVGPPGFTGGMTLSATMSGINPAGASLTRTVLPSLSAGTYLAYSTIDTSPFTNGSATGLVAAGGGYGRILTNHIAAVSPYHPYRR